MIHEFVTNNKGGKEGVTFISLCDYSGILMFQLARTSASAFLFFFGSTFFFFFMAAHTLFLLSQHRPFIRHVQMPWSFGENGYSRHTLTRYSIP